ncbi:MAG TPA: tetratricopeptide repeat protein [Bacteroidales bacterium]|nr:tetratricopeptide repeat protein [Bacteroidales bacterium]
MKKNKKDLQADMSASKKQRYILSAVIAVFAFCLYIQSVSYDYALDDYSVIKGNTLVSKGFAAIPILFVTDRYLGLNDESVRMPEYRPVPMAFFAAESQFFPDNPHAYHFFNTLIYAITCWLLFILLCKLFKNQNYIVPFICSLFYAAHPLHSEVVVNIKSLDEVLCFLFALLSLYFFISEKEKKSVFKFVLASCCYFLSVLSKETGIVYLILTPLTLFVFTKKDNKKIIIITTTMVLITGVFFLIRAKVLASLPDSVAIAQNDPFINALRAAPDFVIQKATAFYILLRYILLLFFPCQLSYDYSIEQIPFQHMSSPGAIIGLLFYLAIGSYAIIKIWKKNIYAYAILFYLLTLVPVSNIFLLINCTMAERFLFMPSLGFCLVLTLLLVKITKTDVFKNKNTPFNQHIRKNLVLFSIVFVITGLYSFRTVTRNPVWKDNATLYAHDVKVATHSARAHDFYGEELLYNQYPRAKTKEEQNRLLDTAIKHFSTALTIYDLPIAYTHLARAYNYKGDIENAIKCYEKNLTYKTVPRPDVLCDLGFLYANNGQPLKALEVLDISLQYYPQYIDAYIKKSHAHMAMGQYQQAIDECDKLLSIDNNVAMAYIYKGACFINMMQHQKAIEELNKALQIESSNMECMRLLSIAYKNIGDEANAQYYAEKGNSLKNKTQQ